MGSASRFIWFGIALFVVLVGSFGLGASFRFDPLLITYEEPHGIAEFFHSLLTHAASAILIAVVVFEAVERSSHLRLEKATERLIESAVGNVARRAAGELHPADIIEESMKSIFSTTLVRENFQHEYIFNKISADGNLVEMVQRIEYTIRNTSYLEAAFEPKFALDNEMSVLESIDGIIRERVVYVKIGDNIFEDNDIELLQNKVEKAGPNQVMSLGVYKISGQSSLDVKIEIRLVKPRTYNTISFMLIPTRGLKVIVDNRIGPSFKADITSVLRNPFGPKEMLSSTEDRWEQRYTDIILPPGGWVVSWHAEATAPEPQG